MSPDQTRIAYDSNINGGFKIFTTGITGGRAQQVTSHEAQDFIYSWSPDGTRLAFHSLRNGSVRDIFSVRLSDGHVVEVSADSLQKYHPRWSADGQMIGFTQIGLDGRKFVLTYRQPDGTWGQEETFIDRGVGSAGMHPAENRLVFNTYTALYVTDLDEYNPELIMDLHRHMNAWWPVWSSDGETIYFTNDMNIYGGIWSIPSSGSEPTQVLKMDGEVLGKGYFGVSDEALYYTLRTLETNLWNMDLSTRNSE